MTKSLKDIGQIFGEVAVLFDLRGDNAFKLKAYQNASRILKNSSMSVEEARTLIEDGKLKGFGKSLRQDFEEIVEEGKLQVLEDLKDDFPGGVLEMLKIPGLGAKKVRTLYEGLGIKSLEELAERCKAGEIASTKGFGKKTEENIITAIERYNTYQSQFLFSKVEKTAESLIEYLRGCELVDEIRIAGSCRRRKEVLKDIDIICSASDGKKVGEFLAKHPDVQEVSGQGATKTSVILSEGLSVDLRVVKQDEFGSALLHFTGSKEQNTELRALAKEKGYKLNEYGLFEGEKRLPLSSEKEIYQELELCFIPPELREGMGEVEQAKDHFKNRREFPPLVEAHDVKGVVHAHSTYSDGRHSLRELAEAAIKKGYQYLGITDHSQTAFYASGLKPADIKKQHKEIDELNKELYPFRIFKGIESDILKDGSLDYEEEVLSSFDFIISSIHNRFGLDEAAMTERIIKAIENPYTTILGHLSGRLLLQREPYEINTSAILEAAAEHGVAVEINANPRRLDLDWRFHQLARDKGVTLAICPDAHSIEGMDDIRYGVGAARKGGCQAYEILTCWDLAKVEEFFKRRKK